MKNKNLLILLMILLFGACQTSKIVVNETYDDRTLYQQSILSAMSPGPDKVYDNLVSINNQNKDLFRKTIKGEEYVLVVTWKKIHLTI